MDYIELIKAIALWSANSPGKPYVEVGHEGQTGSIIFPTKPDHDCAVGTAGCSASAGKVHIFDWAFSIDWNDYGENVYMNNSPFYNGAS